MGDFKKDNIYSQERHKYSKPLNVFSGLLYLWLLPSKAFSTHMI